MSSKFERKEDLELLNWLSPINYGHQQSQFLKMQQPGTGQWFLQSDPYKNWRSTSKQTLFCPGIPGAGKTIMTAMVVDDLRRSVADPTVAIAYIYCNFNRQHEQGINDLIANLTMQLIQSRPSIPENVRCLYDMHVEEGTRPSLDKLSKALSSVAVMFSKVYIIVDALDEAQAPDGRISRFLSEVFQLQRTTYVNFFVTSRPIPLIENEFKGCGLQSISASQDDIGAYLDDHISRLPGFVHEKPELQLEIKRQIINAADGMFLLARLHLDSLVGIRSPTAVRIALQNLPKGSNAYDSAYDEAMKRIKGQVLHSQELAEQTLMWITRAKRQLSVEELQHALAVRPEWDELDEENISQVDDILSVCAGLVTLDDENNIIRLVHYTTQEYFQRTWKHWFKDAEAEIAKTCVSYLMFRTFEDGPCQSRPQLNNRKKVYKLYDYCAKNWGHHAREAPAVSPEVMKFLACEMKFDASNQVLMKIRPLQQRIPRVRLPPERIKRPTGLHIASYFGAAGLVKMLLEKSSAIKSQDICGHESTTGLQFDEGINVEAKDHNGRTALDRAAEAGDEAVVKLLIDYGANINTQDDEGRSALSRAAEFGNEAMAMFLVHQRAGMEAKAGGFDQSSPAWAAMNEHWTVVKFLLSRGFDIEGKDENGRTALSWAVKHGAEATIKLLLDNGADIYSRDREGGTPLSSAAESGVTSIITLLLENGADVDSATIGGWTPVHCASKNGHLEAVSLLLEKGANINMTTDRGSTALYIALQMRHSDVATLLLEQGADVGTRNDEGATSLHEASSEGHREVVSLLIEKGAEINARSKDGGTPMHAASSGGYLDVASLLIEKGAEINARSNDGGTPMHAASSGGYLDVASLLIEKGAEINARSNDGGTPMHAASSGGHLDVVSLLIEKGAEINARSNDGGTPIYMASSEGHLDVVSLLIEKGAEINARSNDGGTPIYMASSEGHLDVVSLLIEKGAEINARNNDGATSMHAASFRDHLEVVSLLIEKGAEINARYNGWTPLHAASHNGNINVTSLLIEKGAEINAKNDNGETPVSLASMEYKSMTIRVLLENGADVTIAKNTGETPLHYSSMHGGPQTVRALLDHGAESMLANKGGIIPLHLASARDHLEIVQVLLESSEASHRIQDNCGRTPLFHAAARGCSQIVRLLLSYSALANVTDHYKTTPLCAAVRNGHAKEVKLLLPLTNIEKHFEDGLGRNLAWWAKMSGCAEIINLVQQHVQKLGFEICESDLSLESSPVPFIGAGTYCKVCTRQMIYRHPYYCCKTCYEFHICQECSGFGVQCLDASHDWEFHDWGFRYWEFYDS
ncbi:hypothetical protein N7453_006890 [Penicillium expansum]|nr:hypothetical protein N7453_006890 [Penicillium expansum]